MGAIHGDDFGAPLVAADKRICATVLGLTGAVGPTENSKRKINNSVHNIRCPTLFLMQLEDELFTRKHCLDLFYRLASSDKRMHAHSGGYPAVPVSELDETLDFLRRQIEKVSDDALV